MRTFSDGVTTWIACAVVLAFFGLWIWQSAKHDQAVKDLPEVERKQLYERTLETVRTTCASSERPELDELCAQQAELLLRFSECDAICHELVRARLSSRKR